MRIKTKHKVRRKKMRKKEGRGKEKIIGKRKGK
jgi:hypothetical protein